MNLRSLARDRMAVVKQMPCIACAVFASICGPTEVHHLNLGGRAGQKRRGDQYTIPLGAWHHRGEPKNGKTASYMRTLYGPSLARESRAFRRCYGTDDELLAKTNELLEQL